jgi:hypothetical protein
MRPTATDCDEGRHACPSVDVDREDQQSHAAFGAGYTDVALGVDLDVDLGVKLLDRAARATEPAAACRGHPAKRGLA